MPISPLPRAGALLLALISAALLADPRTPAAASPAAADEGPIVTEAERHDTGPPLRRLEPTRAGRHHAEPHIVPRGRPARIRGSDDSPARGADPTRQTARPRGTAPAPLVNFEGLSAADDEALYGGPNLPPDPQGDVGPDHYVQIVNRAVAVFDKTSGARLLGPIRTEDLWQGFGGPCELGDGDGIVLYDQEPDRWFISQFALVFQGPNVKETFICIAISETSDPTGAYHRYAFSFDRFADYPKYGVWPNGYYMTANKFSADRLTPLGVYIAAFERDRMLAGKRARAIRFLRADEYGMLPADWDGPDRPPKRERLTVVGFDPGGEDELHLYRVRARWGSPGKSSLGKRQGVPVAPFEIGFCDNLFECIPQPNTGQRLDSLADVLMFRLQYRNFGDRQAMVVNHAVGGEPSGAVSGIRWYQLERPSRKQSWSLAQQGTWNPDADSRWNGSIAMDRDDNLALGYSLSSSSTFPSIAYAGRLADDPPGIFSQGEQTVVLGGDSQTFSNRYGDYSSMNVDPTDECTFWYTNQYIPAGNDGLWQTRIASFRFPSCTP